MVLCGGAAPAAYWEALRGYQEEAVLIHFPDDCLCVIDVGAYARLPLPRLVPVVVPHNAMAWHLLGPSHHNYMEHCVHPETICPVKDIPRTWIPVLRDVHQARTEGATWGTAMTRAGLVPPVDPHAYLETMRAELDGLYERIPALVAHINRVASTSVVRQRLLQQLGQLLV